MGCAKLGKDSNPKGTQGTFYGSLDILVIRLTLYKGIFAPKLGPLA